MLNLYPYLCDDPDMDLSPIREKSERLYRDILRERQYYAEHPECTNIHFFHMVKQSLKTSLWVDRWGIAILSFNGVRFASLRYAITDGPQMRKIGSFGYYRLKRVNCKRKGVHFYIHSLIADAFLPNTDFTKVQLDHINSKHLDNNALNLERVTMAENIRRREVMLCNRKGQPIPWKYQSLKNYLNYLQTKKSKS